MSALIDQAIAHAHMGRTGSRQVKAALAEVGLSLSRRAIASIHPHALAGMLRDSKAAACTKK